MGDLRKKFENFGWDAQEANGHDVGAIVAAIESAKTVKDRPHMIVLQTEKGKDCTFAEGIFYNHHIKFMKEQYEEAVAALDQKIERLQREEV